MSEWTQKDIDAYLARSKRSKSSKLWSVERHVEGENALHEQSQVAKRHKFRARAVVQDGIRFPSMLEGRHYDHLKYLQSTGEVLFFLRQVPFHLPGGTKLVVDFQVFWADGTVSFQDTKGHLTKEFKIKKREVEHHYPIEIEIITKARKQRAA